MYVDILLQKGSIKTPISCIFLLLFFKCLFFNFKVKDLGRREEKKKMRANKMFPNI